jgi:hypothetical protein
VTRGGTRPTAALAAAVLAALLFVACGSSGSGSSSTSAEAGQSGSSQNGSQEQGQNGDQQADGGSQSQKSASGDKTRRFAAKEVSTPLKVSGGGAEQFRSKGGDNSVQEFGGEEDDSELEAAAQVVHDFYVDRAVGDWEGACSHMSRMLREQLEQLASKSEVKGCAPFLEAFTSHLSAATWREITAIDAGSLRRDGESGFLIYNGAKKTVYAMPLKEEDGEWRVTALSAVTLN